MRPLDPGFARLLRDRVAAEREALISLCAALVAARSDQPEGDTREAARVVADFLASRGLVPGTRAAGDTKPNVVCGFAGAKAGPHVVLNGHLDTLPPGDEAAWSVPVWSLARAGGRLTGLGIGNMKAGTAALAVAFAVLAGERERLAGRLTFTAVADEVVFGPDGAAYLIDADPDLLGDALINAEGPGGMDLAIAEKGLLWVRIEASAPPGQGMLSVRGSGAIARLASVLAAIDEWNDEIASPPPGLEILRETSGEHGLRLSVNIGRVAGGGLPSQVATQVHADVDFRVPPGLTIEAVEARLDALLSATPGLSWQRLKGWNPNWTAPDTALVRHASEAAQAVRGVNPRPVVRLPASDAARWRARGVPAICYGPQPTLAAGIDDWVNEDDVHDCAAVYALTAASLMERGS